MFIQINDIEKLPKSIIFDGDILKLFLNTDGNHLYIGYMLDNDDYPMIIIEINGLQNDIDRHAFGEATTLEEAVNMLYEYVMNNPDIKIEE